MTLAALVFAQFLFGALPVATKFALVFATPIELILVRNMGALLIFSGVSSLRNRRFQPDNNPNIEPVSRKTKTGFSLREHFSLVGLALSGASLNQFSLFEGLSRTQAIVAAIVVPTIPLFTVLLATTFGQEKLHRGKLIYCLVGIAGVLLLFLPRLQFGAHSTKEWAEKGNSEYWLGVALCLLSALLSASFLVFSRTLVRKHDAITILKPIYGYGLLISLALALYSSDGNDLFVRWLTPTPSFWFSIIFIVVGSTALSNLINMWAIQRLPASTVSGFVFTQTLIGTALSMVLLGETITTLQLAAAGCIGCALLGISRIAWKENQLSRRSSLRRGGLG